VTTIDFYHGASDKVQAACRLIVELHAQGRKVLVYARSDALATQVERQLWIQPATGFVPHCPKIVPISIWFREFQRKGYSDENAWSGIRTCQ